MEFYSKLFNWDVKYSQEMKYGMVEKSGEGIGGGIMEAEEGQFPPYLTIYIQVDDLQKYLDRAEELGGKTVVPPTAIPNMGSFAMFTDPDGNMVGIYKEGQ